MLLKPYGLYFKIFKIRFASVTYTFLHQPCLFLHLEWSQHTETVFEMLQRCYKESMKTNIWQCTICHLVKSFMITVWYSDRDSENYLETAAYRSKQTGKISVLGNFRKKYPQEESTRTDKTRKLNKHSNNFFLKTIFSVYCVKFFFALIDYHGPIYIKKHKWPLP